ncbi:unnamed protein product [Psylliodes chrysocephalus]|uniref:CHK kinase-like domain-containing protein n=1 Tax=Psylliodes chrysocephalus TaxID=3402493 RepID=A0A9P0CYF7_9CUCU|nr:unnamed protein product [Psylliodes chrysocephala]
MNLYKRSLFNRPILVKIYLFVNIYRHRSTHCFKMGVNSKDVQKWIDEVMAKEGISNYKLNMSGSSSKGDGYLGEINFVKVTADVGKQDDKEYDMVIKTAKSNDELRKKSPIAETYLREIQIYTEVLPAIKQLQKEYSIKNPCASYVTCYTTCKEDKKESLVLANLKTLGYTVHDRTKHQNFDHVLFVFKTYARWHGASMALKKKKPDLFRSITKNMTDQPDLLGQFFVMSGMVPVLKKYCQQGLDLLRKNGKELAAKKIEKEANNVEEMLGSMTLNNDREADTEAVILHGDCWNNNMMFKYKGDDTSKPIDLVFIDYQLSRVASPILDLSYYLYATADKSTLDKLDYLLEEYHKELTNYLRQFNIKSDDILTLKRLKSSWKKYGRFGLGMAGMITRIELCQEDEVVDFTQKIGDGSMVDLEITAIRLQKEYDTRLFNVYYHFAEKFL